MKAVLLLCAVGTASARNSLARTPPMGWMSWELFRCDTDCKDHPDHCISEALYKAQTDALADGGFVAAGYTGIHMDDCWEQKAPPRDKKTGELVPEPTRFPSGLKALGDYMHNKKATFGLYTAESSSTCGGYPASANNEMLDAKQFAEWGVDYLKVDGCGPNGYYEYGYKEMGAALESSGRDIVYSCSWPAYIGSNESTKPFATFVNDGCNLWRNWDDIQCNWQSLGSIIDHWGDYGAAMAPFAGPGHWHDMDMLLIGSNCVTTAEEQTQMAIWSISASPLIMGNDLRNVSDASRAILLNRDAIAVSQDALGQMGVRVTNSSSAPTQLWARNLANGDIAVALYNKAGGGPPAPSAPWPTTCPQWTHTTDGYLEACGGASGDVGTFSDLTLAEAQAACCADEKCAGFSADCSGAGGKCSGYYKSDANCGKTSSGSYQGYTKPAAMPQPAPETTADITVDFSALNLFGSVNVYDIWQQKSVGSFTGSYTAKAVPHHGSAFLRLSSKRV